MIFYQYKAKVIKIVDGDTVVANIDMGFDTYVQKYVRLALINAPELNSSDPEVRVKAQKAKSYLEQILPIGSEFYLDSRKLDPYRRPIAVIVLPGKDKTVNALMLESGNSVPYKG